MHFLITKVQSPKKKIKNAFQVSKATTANSEVYAQGVGKRKTILFKKRKYQFHNQSEKYYIKI